MRHLIVGKGPAGVVAAETIRTLDPEAEIKLVGDEGEPAYSRMAIPYLLTGAIDESGTWLRHDPGHFERLGIEQLDGRVARLTPEAGRAELEDGTTLEWDRLLLACGATPIRPPVPGLDNPGVAHCWTLADARRILQRAQAGSRVVLMGAGFVGCIIMEALVRRGVRLTVVEAGDRMVPRMLDATAGGLLADWCRRQGIEVRTATRITAVEQCSDGLALDCDPGPGLEADLLVVAAGVQPNTGFLDGSGIEIDRGVVVDRHQRTSAPNVWAAGDVCESVGWRGGRGVHAIQPMAVETARVAALEMCGRPACHPGSLDMNVLDTLGLVAVSMGHWNDGDDQALLHRPGDHRYLRLQFEDDRLVGAISLGRTDHVGVLRGLIQSRRPLGRWKARLQADPTRFMEAWVDLAVA